MAENPKKYLLRKAILQALDFYGADVPCDCGDVAAYPKVQLLRCKDSEIAEEFSNLHKFEYVKKCSGFGGQFYNITTKGLQQLNCEFESDPFITGRPRG